MSMTDHNDPHPSTLHADAHIERAAIIRLIKAHAKDCERRQRCLR
jgi:hypothetical protein